MTSETCGILCFNTAYTIAVIIPAGEAEDLLWIVKVYQCGTGLEVEPGWR
jgi:hypothetical protein